MQTSKSISVGLLHGILKISLDSYMARGDAIKRQPYFGLLAGLRVTDNAGRTCNNALKLTPKCLGGFSSHKTQIESHDDNFSMFIILEPLPSIVIVQSQK